MTKTLCSDCKKTIGVSAYTCPHCGGTTLYGRYRKNLTLCFGFDAIFLLAGSYSIITLLTQSAFRIYHYDNTVQVLTAFSGIFIAALLISIIAQIMLSVTYRKNKQAYLAAAERALTGAEPISCLNGCRHCKSSDCTIADSPTVYCHWYLRDMDAKVACERYGGALAPLTQEQNQVS